MKREVNWESRYKSPITIESVCEKIVEKHNNDMFQFVYDVICKYGVDVDKEELFKALLYDRNQFREGYLKGCADARAEIIRCKDCIHYSNAETVGWCYRQQMYGWKPNDFCSYGEPREDEEE